MNLSGTSRNVVNQILTRPEKKCGGQPSIFVVPLEQIVAKAKVQCKFLGNLPVVLYKSAEFHVPPMALIGCQLCQGLRYEAGINARSHAVWRINREEKWIVKIIRGARYVELGILDVAPHLTTDFDVV